MRSHAGRRWFPVAACLAAVACLSAGTALESSAAQLDSPPAFQAPPGGPFSPTSVWKADVTGAPVAANSAALVANLAGQVSSQFGGVAAFNMDQHSSSFYTVDAGQPRLTVEWDDCQGKGFVPLGLFGAGGQFEGVPVPAGAVPAAGSDAGLTVYQPSTDTLWDFWQTKQLGDGWHACWGGRIDHVSTSGGFFLGGFGASASGLAASGGQIGIREAQGGVIPHAIALAIPNVAVNTDVSWPAQRSDGTDPSPNSIPEGARFRLDRSVDVDSLHLHPLAAMIAHAAQTFGMVVTDRSGAVAVTAESGAATQTATGTDPWVALLGGTQNYAVMKGFPWNRLQALPQNYGKH